MACLLMSKLASLAGWASKDCPCTVFGMAILMSGEQLGGSNCITIKCCNLLSISGANGLID